MNINMPGFTGENSVYRTRSSYQSVGILKNEVGVLAQAPIGSVGVSTRGKRFASICHARCVGGFIGGGFGCANAPDTDQCLKDNSDNFTNCTDGCSFIASIIE